MENILTDKETLRIAREFEKQAEQNLNLAVELENKARFLRTESKRLFETSEQLTTLVINSMGGGV
jgi:hypothetical protein